MTPSHSPNSKGRGRAHATWRRTSTVLLALSLLFGTSGGSAWSLAEARAAKPADSAAPAAGVVPPRLLEAPPVQRPDDAASNGAAVTPLSGHRGDAIDAPVAQPEVNVDLQLTIDTDGHVGDAHVVNTGGEAFDDAALAAVRQFRFSPAARDGVPIAARVTYRYRFPAVVPVVPVIVAPVAEDPTAPTPAASVPSGDSTTDEQTYGATATIREPARGTTQRTVSGNDLVATAGTRGDALRVIELLPGVARPPLGAGSIIIRGSAPNDSEISFEGAQVLRLYHFGGLTSFVNGRLVDHIDLYPGNFSTKYGRKLGGMVDVGARDPRTDGWHGLADVNVIDATVLAEGPIGPRAAMALSLRRSYIGDVLKAVSPAGTMLAAPVYDDYQLFATWRPTERDRIRFLGYGSRDSLELIFKAPDQDPALRGAGAARTYFHRAQVSWEHRHSDRLRTSAQVTVGRLGFAADLGEALHQDISGPELFARGEMDLRLNEQFQLTVGIDATNQWLTARYHGPIIGATEGDPGQMGAITNQQTTDLNATALFARPALYVEGIWRSGVGLTVIGGSRVDYFGDIGRWTFDPRITARQTLGASTTLKGGAGLFSQAPDYGQAVPGFGNPNLRAARALHLDVGVDQNIGDHVTAGVETFAKSMWHLVVGGSQPGMLNNDGVGRVYGLEASLKARGTRATAFLAYTLSRSERRDHPKQGDAWRLFDYDQTHILTAAGNLSLGRNWLVGGTFRLVSGNPETPVVGSVYDADRDVYRPIYGAVNSARNPLFHRLDVRIEKQWHPGRLLLAGYLDLQNAYNHQVRETTGYGFDFRQRTGVTGLPIFPSIGLRGEL